MKNNTVIRACIDAPIHEKALTCEPLIPNKQTIAAMKAARKGELKKGTVDTLLDDLNEAV